MNAERISMLVDGQFDKIFSCECKVDEPRIVGNRLTVPVESIGVIEGHPLFQKLGYSSIRYFRVANLIFEGVTASVREMSDHIGDPTDRKFGPPYSRHDGPFDSVSGPTQTFSFEGRPRPPRAWVDWTITAASFSLEVLDDRSPEWFDKWMAQCGH